MGLTSCISAPPPYQDYTIARTALQSAKDADAEKFVPGLWSQVQDDYRKGEQSFKNSEFDAADKYFKLTIKYAEQAENATRLKKFESGDTFP